jgi:hypothetical protein
MHVPSYKGFQMMSSGETHGDETHDKKNMAVGPKGFEPMTARL